MEEKKVDKCLDQVDIECEFQVSDQLIEKEAEDQENQACEELPYPQFSKLSFNYFEQTSPFRLISIKMISNPYPFHNEMMKK